MLTLVYTEDTMLPQPLDCIRLEALERFADTIMQDDEATMFAHLLGAEEQVSGFVRQLGREMLQKFVDVRLEQTKSNKVSCPSCGLDMEWLLNSKWKRGTPLGTITVADVYAYCRTCHESARPLHSWLGTARERWSLAVEEAAVDLAADESCQKASGKLERHHPGLTVGRTTVLRMMHKHGALAREFIKHKLGKAMAQAAHDGRSSGGLVELEVEHDGGMIPVAELQPIPVEPGQEPERTPVRGLVKRRKRTYWQEAKVGLVQVPGELERLYRVRPTTELDQPFDDLLALACLKGWTEQTEVRGIADGARHIREPMAETFNGCSFRFILDRPHACEHLSEAGETLEPLSGIAAQQWADEAMNKLEAGEVMSVVVELRNAYVHSGDEQLRLNANYFERNKDSVAYADYRARGWSQASSEVESAHRHIVQFRMKIPGAWWHPDNVPNVLALPMLKANGWWQDYWSEQRNPWSERARQLQLSDTTDNQQQAAAA